MRRKLWTREELETVFRINEVGELMKLLKNKQWAVVDCKSNRPDGYCSIRFKESTILYHTVVWILINGSIDDKTLVLLHIDGDKLNNNIENLKLTTKRESLQNQTCHMNGKFAGAYFSKLKNKWRANIRINNKLIHLGFYNSELEAHQIYLKACTLVSEYVDSKQFKQLIKEV